jgi:Transcriptional regulatory protein, C terminal
MGLGKVLIIHQQNSDCSALKSVLSRERYEVIEASLDMGTTPFNIEDCCVILLDALAAAPGREASRLGSGSPNPDRGARNTGRRRFVRRRASQMPRKGRASSKVIGLGERTVLLHARVVRGSFGEIRLTRLECGVLTHLLAHANQTVPSVELVRRLWPSDTTKGVHSLRAFIKNLRKKIEPDPARPQYIVTDLAIGYRLQILPTAK